MNKKTIYIIVAVLVVVIVVAGAAILLMNGGFGGEPTATPTPNPGVAGASSLQFTVEDTTGTYLYSAKNISSGLLLNIQYCDVEAGFSIIIDGVNHKAYSNMTGTWVEEAFQTTWDQWYPLFEGYVDSLAHWTSGEWTSADGKVKIYDILVNPTLSDSLFQVPS